ncbi:Oidioi.mRNA.OKI2018_I69.chr2.g4715.t1.cds [Oikopleura dioica]|uniref:Oidioi.mRNA.OKI2018_I69.chr2.g4715.t1.cds n=1 Tax=Oikopleura dioica TaxID=34765 RepID=A0ABN7T4S3_OIKDI|nr:Oidioi.mRNA.OKI2018_I69.chr2.g4715.t1.cds [Oikopleura dioica]
MDLINTAETEKKRNSSDESGSGSSTQITDGITSTEGLLQKKLEDCEDLVPNRQTWSRKAEFILAVIAFAVGLGNVWRFPYLCYKNGGGAFFIPYLIMCVFGGIPIFFLELSLGQFMKAGGIRAWDLVPLFRGIGVSSAVCVCFCNIYYIMVLAWAIFYLVNSFTASDLPWETCDNTWSNQSTCFSHTTSRGLFENDTGICAEPFDERQLSEFLAIRTPVQDFWENRVLQKTDRIEDQGEMRWELVACLAFAWLTCWLSVSKGVKSSGKVAWVTAIYPYIILSALFIRAITLPGAAEGISFYLKPDWSKLLTTKIWIDAGTQIFFSYAIGLGALTALGSYNKFDNNCYRDAILLSLVNSGTSVFAGFAVFAFLGFMSCESGIDIEHVATSGPGLAFLVYPKGITMMPHSPVWAVAFFTMILVLGTGSQMVGMESFLTAVSDLSPTLQRHRAKFSLLVTICFFLIGLIFCTKGGVHTFQIFDNFGASGFALLWLSFWEAVAIGWGYGGEKYLQTVERMTGKKCSRYFVYCWKFLTPLATTSIFALCLTKYERMKYENQEVLPLWAEGLGWCLALSSMICIPVMGVIQLIKQKGSLGERLKASLEPKIPRHVFK